jgi:methylenetetrahydrofolate reductase (NADPH)
MRRSTHRASRDGYHPIRVSIEFFPPKTEEMEKILWGVRSSASRHSSRASCR